MITFVKRIKQIFFLWDCSILHAAEIDFYMSRHTLCFRVWIFLFLHCRCNKLLLLLRNYRPVFIFWSSSCCSVNKRYYFVQCLLLNKISPFAVCPSAVNFVCRNIDIFGNKLAFLNHTLFWRFLLIKTLIVLNMNILYVCIFSSHFVWRNCTCLIFLPFNLIYLIFLYSFVFMYLFRSLLMPVL